MVSAIVLLTVERDKINSVADAIADIDGVSEVYSIAGRYDLAAIIRVKTNDDMAKVVTERIRKVGGITIVRNPDIVPCIFATRFGADVLDWNGTSIIVTGGSKRSSRSNRFKGATPVRRPTGR